jgi:hypothetical protein
VDSCRAEKERPSARRSCILTRSIPIEIDSVIVCST